MRYSLLFLFQIFCFVQLLATHNIGGSISYRHISGYNYEITVNTTTDYNGAAQAADRCTLKVRISNGDSITLPRINGVFSTCSTFGSYDGEVFVWNSRNLKKNVYRAQYDFTQAGNFLIYLEDPNRTSGIINIAGSSDQEPMRLEATLNIHPFINCPINSVICENKSIAAATIGVPFSYSPFVSNPDGDSLKFELISPIGGNGNAIAGYMLPTGITINEHTGLINIPNLFSQGNFIVAIKISQYRNGYLVGTVVKEVMISCAFSGNYQGGFIHNTGNWIVDTEGNYTLHNIPGNSFNFSIKYGCSSLTGSNIIGTSGGIPLGANVVTNTIGDSIIFNGSWNPTISDLRDEPYIFSFLVNNSPNAFIDFENSYSILIYVDGSNPAQICNGIGIEEKENSNFIAYPSPANEYIECNYIGVNCNKITLVNIIGQEVVNECLTQITPKAVLNTNTIHSGIYYLLLKKDNTVISRKKIIIEH